MHPLQRPDNRAGKFSCCLAVGINPLRGGIKNRGGIGLGAERLLHSLRGSRVGEDGYLTRTLFQLR